MGSLRVATLFGLLALGSLASAQDVKLWVEGDRLSADVSETAVVSEQALLASVAYLTGAEGPEVNAEVSREILSVLGSSPLSGPVPTAVVLAPGGALPSPAAAAGALPPAALSALLSRAGAAPAPAAPSSCGRECLDAALGAALLGTGASYAVSDEATPGGPGHATSPGRTPKRALQREVTFAASDATADAVAPLSLGADAAARLWASEIAGLGAACGLGAVSAALETAPAAAAAFSGPAFAPLAGPAALAATRPAGADLDAAITAGLSAAVSALRACGFRRVIVVATPAWDALRPARARGAAADAVGTQTEAETGGPAALSADRTGSRPAPALLGRGGGALSRLLRWRATATAAAVGAPADAAFASTLVRGDRAAGAGRQLRQASEPATVAEDQEEYDQMVTRAVSWTTGVVLLLILAGTLVCMYGLDDPASKDPLLFGVTKTAAS